MIMINGQQHEMRGDARTSLLEFVRLELGLTGTKLGCNQGGCGACTVLIDGRRALSCLTLAVQCVGREVVTIEGLSDGETLHELQRLFVEHDGFQCGYCTPGQICSAIGMIAEAEGGVPSRLSASGAASPIVLTPEEVRERMSGNLCRCGAYNGIVAAILEMANAGDPA